MTNQFIEATIRMATYRIKEGTTTSYYYVSGDKILPNRISVQIGAKITHAAKRGRMVNKQITITGELRGIFTMKEESESPLRRFLPYAMSTTLFRCDEYPHILGYGALGISNEEGRITKSSEAGIIIVNQDATDPEYLKIFFMEGATETPNVILDLMAYVSKYLY